jgi:hypothetical protein
VESKCSGNLHQYIGGKYLASSNPFRGRRPHISTTSCSRLPIAKVATSSAYHCSVTLHVWRLVSSYFPDKVNSDVAANGNSICVIAIICLSLTIQWNRTDCYASSQKCLSYYLQVYRVTSAEPSLILISGTYHMLEFPVLLSSIVVLTLSGQRACLPSPRYTIDSAKAVKHSYQHLAWKRIPSTQRKTRGSLTRLMETYQRRPLNMTPRLAAWQHWMKYLR